MDSIGDRGGLGRTALEAALKRHAETLARLRSDEAAPPAGKVDFAKSLVDGVRELDQSVAKVDRLPMDMLNGNVTDIHEVAARVKQADLSLKFALQVRNKLIDAYREVMRMSV